MVAVQGSPCAPIPQGLRIKYTPAKILSALLEGRAQTATVEHRVLESTQI
jgi:hypothetical protein